MRRDCSHLFPLISILFLFSPLSYGQAWSGVLAPSRAIDWSHAGLPTPTLPDLEIVPNPWTPPTRTLCTTLTPSGGDDAPQINAAVSGCAQGIFVLLNTGTFTISSLLRLGGSYTSNHNYVTVRGNGPMNTKIHFSGGSAGIAVGASQNQTGITLASNPARGAPSVTLSSTPNVVAGQLAWLQQCDNGISGATCASGTHVDNGGLYFCGYDNVCKSDSGFTTNPGFLETQIVYVTSVVGNLVNFTPAIYFPDFSTTRPAQLASNSLSSQANGIGLEDFTIIEDEGVSGGITFTTAYASWIKGGRIVYMGRSSGYDVGVGGQGQGSKNIIVANNYLAGRPDGGIHDIFGYGEASDSLVINNIMDGGTMEGTGSDSGIVLAYNYVRDTYYAQPYGNYQHLPGSAFTLMEGNEIPRHSDDDTWGSHTL